MIGREVEIVEVSSDSFQRALRAGTGAIVYSDTRIIPFDPINHLERFERDFPEQMQLFRLVGIHPRDTTVPINPYTGSPSTERLHNVGEHCIAVAYCAEKIAHALARTGHISTDDVRWIVERALVHDLNKPFEIMRRNAQRSGIVQEVYSVAAYEMLKPLLASTGISEQLSEYLIRAGAETGHNSLKEFILPGASGLEGLVTGKVCEKIVHLADDMTFTNAPRDGQRPTTVFLTCWERMLAAQFIEKYPFLWTEGLARNEQGSIIPVKDVGQIPSTYTLLGDYAELQVRVAGLIAQELKLLIAPESRIHPESFVRQLVTAPNCTT